MSTPGAVVATEPTIEQLKAQIAQLQSRLQSRSNGNTHVFSNGLSIRVNSIGKTTKDKDGKDVANKGNMSIYGLGKFPWSPYLSQVMRVIEIVKSGELEAFLTEHLAEFAVKEK